MRISILAIREGMQPISQEPVVHISTVNSRAALLRYDMYAPEKTFNGLSAERQGILKEAAEETLHRFISDAQTTLQHLLNSYSLHIELPVSKTSAILEDTPSELTARDAKTGDRIHMRLFGNVYRTGKESLVRHREGGFAPVEDAWSHTYTVEEVRENISSGVWIKE